MEYLGLMSKFLVRESRNNSNWKRWGGQSRADVNSDQAAPSQLHFIGIFLPGSDSKVQLSGRITLPLPEGAQIRTLLLRLPWILL